MAHSVKNSSMGSRRWQGKCSNGTQTMLLQAAPLADGRLAAAQRTEDDIRPTGQGSVRRKGPCPGLGGRLQDTGCPVLGRDPRGRPPAVGIPPPHPTSTRGRCCTWLQGVINVTIAGTQGSHKSTARNEGISVVFCHQSVEEGSASRPGICSLPAPFPEANTSCAHA